MRPGVGLMKVGFRSLGGVWAWAGVEKPSANSMTAMITDRTMSFFMNAPFA